jgi:cell wall-associated NlpC family hydrolase
MGKLVGAAVVALLAMTVGLVTVAAVGGASGSAGSGAGGDRGEAAGRTGGGGRAAIPPDWLTLYQKAAATCPGLSWSVVAAIGTVETGSGQSSAPGVWSGANPAGAEGPMQFEPATFAAYATVGPGGARPPSPYDPVDAVYSAATMLCADGAGSAATLRAAVDDYNHSAAYVDTVLALSLSFQQDPTTPGMVVAALSFAARQLGTPYVWGGTGVGGFDCSGLVQAAFAHAGVVLPRVAQDQYDAGPPVPVGSPVEPGDLVFFGGGPSSVEHVGIYVGEGEMIDAPHTGTVVRFDDAAQADLVGATGPG